MVHLKQLSTDQSEGSEQGPSDEVNKHPEGQIVLFDSSIRAKEAEKGIFAFIFAFFQHCLGYKCLFANYFRIDATFSFFFRVILKILNNFIVFD